MSSTTGKLKKIRKACAFALFITLVLLVFTQVFFVAPSMSEGIDLSATDTLPIYIAPLPEPYSFASYILFLVLFISLIGLISISIYMNRNKKWFAVIFHHWKQGWKFQISMLLYITSSVLILWPLAYVPGMNFYLAAIIYILLLVPVGGYISWLLRPASSSFCINEKDDA